MPQHLEEDIKFVNQFEIDFFDNPDALEQALYEDVLIRKKSVESMNSLVPPEEEHWGKFGGCDNSFSNPEDENRRDKEILPNVEMDDNESTVVTPCTMEETLAPKFNLAVESEPVVQP